MRIHSSKLIASLLTALVTTASLSLVAPAPAYDTVEVIQRNTAIVINGWHIKADEIIRRSDGVVKAVGNAHAMNDERRCSGSADKIVLNLDGGRITFIGAPRVEVDHVLHVGAHGADLCYDYRHDRWSAE